MIPLDKITLDLRKKITKVFDRIEDPKRQLVFLYDLQSRINILVTEASCIHKYVPSDTGLKCVYCTKKKKEVIN